MVIKFIKIDPPLEQQGHGVGTEQLQLLLEETFHPRIQIVRGP